MSNGKAGDHPISDIIDHRIQVYSPQIDALVRRLAALIPRDELVELFDWFAPPPLPEFENRLKEKVVILERDAQRRGWDA